MSLKLPPYPQLKFWNCEAANFTRYEPLSVEEWQKRQQYKERWCVAIQESDICVVDIDVKEGRTDGIAYAREELGWNIEKLVLSTYSVRTKSGGLHLYFQKPPHINKKSKVGGCIDLLAGNAFVWCTPTQGYSAITAPPTLAPLPSYIAKLWAPHLDDVSEVEEVKEVEDIAEYKENCLKRARANVAAAQPGERNDVLNKSAYWMGQLGIGFTSVKEEMVKATMANGDFDEDSEKVLGTIKRAYEDGKKHPKNVVEKRGVSWMGLTSAVLAQHSGRIACVAGDWYERISPSGYWRKTHMTERAILNDALQQTIAGYGLSPKELDKATSPKSMLVGVSSLLDLAGWYRDENFFVGEPHLIMCGDEVVDLRRGKVVSEPAFRTTRRTIPIKEGACSEWFKFLDYAFEGDAEMIHWLRCAMAYSLSGATNWNAMFSVYGRAKTGKSTFMRVLSALSGEYGDAATEETLLKTKQPGNPYLAFHKYRGCRVLMKNEIKEGAVFNADMLKALVSGDEVSARGHHKDFEKVKPTAKVWMTSNDLPHFGELDAGLQRRLRIIAIDRVITQDRPHYFEDCLQPILSEILYWVLDVAPEAFKEEPRVPERVKLANAAAIDDEQPMTRFCREELIPDEDHRLSTHAIFGAYVRWCERNGEPQPDESLVRKMGKILKVFTGVPTRQVKIGGKNYMGISGWRLTEPDSNTD